jgi:hypothetical protein
MAKAEVAGYKQLTQIAEEVITNTGRKVQAMQRKQQEAASDGAAEDPAQAGPSAMELKLQEHQLKMQIAEQKAQLDMQIKQSKAEQDRTLKDAERALKFAGNSTI